MTRSHLGIRRRRPRFSPGKKRATAGRNKPGRYSNNDDRERDLEPERPAEPFQRDLGSISPRIGQQAGSELDESHRYSQPPRQQFRAIEETQPQQQERRERGPRPEELGVRPALHAGGALPGRGVHYRNIVSSLTISLGSQSQRNPAAKNTEGCFH